MRNAQHSFNMPFNLKLPLKCKTLKYVISIKNSSTGGWSFAILGAFSFCRFDFFIWCLCLLHGPGGGTKISGWIISNRPENRKSKSLWGEKKKRCLGGSVEMKFWEVSGSGKFQIHTLYVHPINPDKGSRTLEPIEIFPTWIKIMKWPCMQLDSVVGSWLPVISNPNPQFFKTLLY